MAGSPKKRARREAAERARLAAAQASPLPASAGEQNTPPSGLPAGLDASRGVELTEPAASQPAPTYPVPLRGEVLPPVAQEVEPTRTALKRAMRARAQEHAEAAIAVLVASLNSEKETTRVQAANDLLAWGFGKPATEIEAGEGAQMIVIRKFGESNE